MTNVIFDSNIYIFHSIAYPDAVRAWNKYMMEGSLADDIISVDESIARKTAEPRRFWKKESGKQLKLPDALIAATAMDRQALLLSNNDRDFLYLSKSHELKYDNPIQDQQELLKYVSEKQNDSY